MRSWGWDPHDGISALIRRERDTRAFFLSTMWKHSKKADVCKPGIELLPEPDHAGTLISDFQPPELWENKYLLVKPPSLWYFVMAVQGDQEQGSLSWPVRNIRSQNKGWKVTASKLLTSLPSTSRHRHSLLFRMWVHLVWSWEGLEFMGGDLRSYSKNSIIGNLLYSRHETIGTRKPWFKWIGDIFLL